MQLIYTIVKHILTIFLHFLYKMFTYAQFFVYLCIIFVTKY